MISNKSRSCHKITEFFFKKKQGCGNNPSTTAMKATLPSSKHDYDIETDDPDAEMEMEWEQTVTLTPEQVFRMNKMK